MSERRNPFQRYFDIHDGAFVVRQSPAESEAARKLARAMKLRKEREREQAFNLALENICKIGRGENCPDGSSVLASFVYQRRGTPKIVSLLKEHEQLFFVRFVGTFPRDRDLEQQYRWADQFSDKKEMIDVWSQGYIVDGIIDPAQDTGYNQGGLRRSENLLVNTESTLRFLELDSGSVAGGVVYVDPEEMRTRGIKGVWQLADREVASDFRRKSEPFAHDIITVARGARERARAQL